MVSAVSRVVERTEVINAINSSMLPPAALNEPPARLIATPISEASIAKLAETVLILLNKTSKPLASIPNCLIAATAVSAVSAILSNVGASSVLAKALSAISVSLTDKPVCLRIRPVFMRPDDDTPNVLARLKTVFSKPFNCVVVWPET